MGPNLSGAAPRSRSFLAEPKGVDRSGGVTRSGASLSRIDG